MEPKRAVLSIRQPWAWAIVNGWKPVENRTWHSSYRGPLLIHAGKREEREDVDDVLALVSKQNGLDIHDLRKRYEREKALGAIVGRCVMRGCASSFMDAERGLLEFAWEHVQQWWCGPHGFLLTDAEPLSAPIPMRGRLGIWFVDTEDR